MLQTTFALPIFATYLTMIMIKLFPVCSGEKHGEMDSSTESGYSVEYVSDQVISCLLRQDCHLLLAPLYIRVAVLLRTLLPALYRYIINKRALKEKKNQ